MKTKTHSAIIAVIGVLCSLFTASAFAGANLTVNGAFEQCIYDAVPDGEAKWGFPNLSDTAEIVELASCGAHLVMYTTGRGSVAGCALVPVIKVCANPETFRRMADDMDVNAGVIATGERSENDVAEELYGKVLEVANGAKSRPEALGHREFFLGYKSFECRPGNVARESYVCALTKMLCS